MQIWCALGVPEAQREAFLRRHEVDEEPSNEDYADAEAGLVKAVELWREAAEAVVAREEAMVALMAFEQKTIAPERLLDRRGSLAVAARPSTAVASGSTGAGLADDDGGALASEGRPATSGAESGGGTPTDGEGHKKAARGAAWLLKEVRRREALRLKISHAESRLMVVLPRLEASGDAVWNPWYE